MTTEEKAKAYDETLKRIKEFYRDYDNISNLIDVKKELESIFPQLHESKDEQTRKRLIDFISNIKAISESGRNTLAVRKDDAEMCDTFLLYLEKQKAQKPAEWSDKDKYILKNIHDFIKENTINPNRVNCAEECLNWLNSLPERLNLQPKQEWGEEDECYINGLIGLIEDMEVGISPKLRGVAADRCVAFLKSLRPRPHWKPSEEQMNCLCAAVDAAIRKHNESVSEYKPARVLKSLYEQLQRLGVKEEPEYYQHFDPDC